MVQLNGTTKDGQGREQASRYVTVEPPPAHEGVGRALRSVYYPPANELPEDIIALMKCLDGM
jgi:hypothetical protein